MGKFLDLATGTKPIGPSEEVLAFVRALARRRARLDAMPPQPANENDRAHDESGQ